MVFDTDELPTIPELESIISQFSDGESIERFRLESNRQIESINRRMYADPDYWEVIASLCQQIGYSFDQIAIAIFRRGYYLNLFSGVIRNPRVALEWQQGTHSFSGVKAAQDDHAKAAEHLAQRFAFFAESQPVVASFWQSVNRSENPQVKKLSSLVAQERTNYLKQAIVLTTGKMAASTISFQCPFCGKFDSSLRSKGFSRKAHCASQECTKVYNRQKKQRYAASKATPAWVPAHPKKRRCRGCRCQRQVNLDQLCKKCFVNVSAENL
jgi:hypothetical protein